MANTNQVDFMSSLPDEILLIILSKLSTVEQARTSILSHRWTDLWTFNTGCLTIDAADFIPIQEIMQSKINAQMQILKFTDAVDQILRMQRSQIIDQFKLTYPPDPYGIPGDRLKLDSWISIVRQKQVKALHLDFKVHGVKISSLYSSTFSSLVTLSLQNVSSLSDRIIHRLLSNLSNLLELSIIDCQGLNHLSIASSLKLKHFELIGNLIAFLEISAPNLVSFSFSTFMDLPLWPRIYFNNITLLTQLSCPLVGDIPGFPELANLEQMNVRLLSGEDDSLLLQLLAGLFKVSPRLDRLSLDLQADIRQHNFNENFPGHEFLKELEIDNLEGSEHELQLLICIAESCPSLRKIIIHPSLLHSVVNKPKPDNVDSFVNKLAARLPRKEMKIMFKARNGPDTCRF